MRRTMFEAGFSSPTHVYGVVHPQMGSLWGDIKNFLTKPPAPAGTTPPPAPAPQPTGTVLGIPTNYVLIGGAVALGLSIVAAVVAARKKAGPPPVPPRRR